MSVRARFRGLLQGWDWPSSGNGRKKQHENLQSLIFIPTKCTQYAKYIYLLLITITNYLLHVSAVIDDVYVFSTLCAFGWNKMKWLTARMHGMESFKITNTSGLSVCCSGSNRASCGPNLWIFNGIHILHHASFSGRIKIQDLRGTSCLTLQRVGI